MNIFLEGGIGAGKSTIVAGIRQMRNTLPVYDEPTNEWRNWKGQDYLALYYADKVKHAFKFQQVLPSLQTCN